MDDVPDHNGKERLPGDVLFGDPGTSLGELYSATTGVNRDEKRGAKTSWVNAVAIAGVCLLFGSFFATEAMGIKVGDWSAMPARAWAFGAALAAIVTVLTRPIPRSSYVGALGVSETARFLGLGLPARGFRFADAAGLEHKITRVFSRHGYRGTTFRWDWRSPEGRVMFTIRGAFPEYDIRTKTPVIPGDLRRDHPVYFGLAAEAAWQESQRR